eukprot:COSAG05_NODE_209_length_14039_cov_138.574892_15_plen_298_part_00
MIDIVRQVATHLIYLHKDCKRIHGDLKPRNIVKVSTDDMAQSKWILIDMDASCALSTAAGQKVTSSAFFPPEMACRELNHKDKTTVTATVEFEMWYFGLLVFQMCTLDGETVWKSSQADNLVDEKDLEKLAYHFETMKLELTERIVWQDAADLALWCLQPNPARRFHSMEQVLSHPFFFKEELSTCFPPEMARNNVRYDNGMPSMTAFYIKCQEEPTLASFYCTFHLTNDINTRAHQLHEAVEAGNGNAVKELFHQGGIHYNKTHIGSVRWQTSGWTGMRRSQVMEPSLWYERHHQV